MYTHAETNRLLDPRDHVGIAGDEDKIAELFAGGVDDEVGDQAGVDSFLGASLTPLNELAGAKLDSGAGAQRALVAVRAGVWDAVVPVLAVNWLVELLGDHSAEGCHYLG